MVHSFKLPISSWSFTVSRKKAWLALTLKVLINQPLIFCECCILFCHLPGVHPLSAFAFAFTHSPLSDEMLGDSPSPSVPAVLTGQVHLLFPSIPFWQAACSCHNQDFLAVSLVRLNPYAARNTQCLLTWENYRECIQDYTGFDLEVHRPPSHHLKCTGRACVFPSKSQYDLVETTCFLLGLFKGLSEHIFSMHSTEWRKETLQPHSRPPWTSSGANIWRNWALLI